eukprot:PITA_04610
MLFSELWAYRTSVKTSTGFTPFQLVYGLEAVLPTKCEIPSLQIFMSTPLQTYIGFADGACHSTWNISSAAWVIYSPSDELVSMHGVSLSQTTNNIAEYNAVIELLSESISFGIRILIVRLDSELIVLQLNRVYAIRNPMLLRSFLRVHLLKREFDYIEYQHILRYLNTLADAVAS